MQTSARYYDGKHSTAYTVNVYVDGRYIIGHEEGNGVLFRWPLADTHVIPPPHHDQPTTLTCETSTPAARLHLPTVFFRQAIQPLLPQKTFSLPHITLSWGSIGVWAAAAALVCVLIFWGLPQLTAPLARILPESWEKALGERLIANVASRGKLCESLDGLQALDKIRTRLMGGENHHTFSIRVISHGEVNAFAAPGNNIIFLSGLIRKAKSAEEVAAVMAHEMAHITQRHTTEGLLRNLGLLTAAYLMFGDAGNIGMLATFSYSRDDEREADAVALETLRNAHISPSHMASFFGRLQENEPTWVQHLQWASYFSTHPHTQERIEAARYYAIQTEIPVLSPKEWQALRDICHAK